MLKQLLLCGLALGGLAGCHSSSSATPEGSGPALSGPVVNSQPVASPNYQPAPMRRTAPAPLTPPPHSPTSASASVPRSWIPTAAPEPWKYIVIHHSDTKTGCAAAFDQYHRTVHHWDSLGYHFVIGNGTGSRDGQVEVGPRWPAQKWGAHAGVKEYNEYGIGICLVGDFSMDRPSAAQMRSLAQLTGYLMRAYHIPANHVIGHHDVRQTNCPGKNFPLASLRRMAAGYAAGEIDGVPYASRQ